MTSTRPCPRGGCESSARGIRSHLAKAWPTTIPGVRDLARPRLTSRTGRIWARLDMESIKPICGTSGDGLKLSHQIHLLEFITDDFYRMQTVGVCRIRETGARQSRTANSRSRTCRCRGVRYYAHLARSEHLGTSADFATVEFCRIDRSRKLSARRGRRQWRSSAGSPGTIEDPRGAAAHRQGPRGLSATSGRFNRSWSICRR